MNPRVRAITPLLVDVVAPLLVYAVLHRVLGLGDAAALTIGGLVGGVGVAVEALRRRRLDRLGVLVLVLFGVTLALVLVTGDPRIVLVKPAVVTACAGLYCLATLAGRPLVADTGRPFAAARGPAAVAAWEVGCRTTPEIRRTVWVLTLVWGVALLADAVGRTVVALVLPVDTAVWATQLPGLGIVLAVVVSGIGMRRLRSVLRPAAAPAPA